MHGSHVAFVNEGLVDLDLQLSGRDVAQEDIYQHQFQCITVCHAGAAFTLSTLHKQRPINQILCREYIILICIHIYSSSAIYISAM